MKKIFITSIIFIFLFITYLNILSFSTGIGGRTRKNLNEPEIGCSCHKILASPQVVVRITGPSQVEKYDTAVYRITMTGGPEIKGGFDYNVARGSVDVAEPDSTHNFGKDITHRFPKIFGGRDTVDWSVKYIAPNTIGPDTLYATGNSCNGDGFADSLDLWNFSEDFIVTVIDPIGITKIRNNIPKHFSLSQNYPNPFNPVTRIQFDISSNVRREKSNVRLIVYDILGRE
ncbi:MAG: choice-of-anchor V domain-containing protein, partial [Ignavibacteria bacterium]